MDFLDPPLVYIYIYITCTNTNAKSGALVDLRVTAHQTDIYITEASVNTTVAE